MGTRPNFTDVRLDEAGGVVHLRGNSDDEPLPVEIRVFLEQGQATAGGPANVAFGSVDRLTTGWVAELPATGFKTGPALASGVEVRMEPFTATSWTEQVTL